MSKFAHENIAQYYTAFVVKLELWVVMRLYGGGSVLDVMKHILKTVSSFLHLPIWKSKYLSAQQESDFCFTLNSCPMILLELWITMTATLV